MLPVLKFFNIKLETAAQAHLIHFYAISKLYKYLSLITSLGPHIKQ